MHFMWPVGTAPCPPGTGLCDSLTNSKGLQSFKKMLPYHTTQFLGQGGRMIPPILHMSPWVAFCFSMADLGPESILFTLCLIVLLPQHLSLWTTILKLQSTLLILSRYEETHLWVYLRGWVFLGRFSRGGKSNLECGLPLGYEKTVSWAPAFTPLCSLSVGTMRLTGCL